VVLLLTLPLQVVGDSPTPTGTYAINLVAMVEAPIEGDPRIALFTCADSKCRDFFGSNLEKVLIVAKAQGRKPDQRALFDFENVNLVKGGKSVGSKYLKGYVLGQDGQLGLASKYIDHVGCTGVYSIQVDTGTPALAMILGVSSDEGL
jgi:hypothetical protein